MTRESGKEAGALSSAPVLESRGASRGFTADVLICDEAQELTDEQMAALMPVISAGRKQNSQTILIGTPPNPTCTAEVFKATRDRALSESPGKSAGMSGASARSGTQATGRGCMTRTQRLTSDSCAQALKLRWQRWLLTTSRAKGSDGGLHRLLAQ